MKVYLSIFSMFLLGFISTTSFSQEKTEETPQYGWKNAFVGGINATQTSFDNWSQGGENSFAWQASINFDFTNVQEKTSWANSGKFTYGQTKSGDAETRKSVDEIKFESVLTYKMNIYINPFIAVTGETQIGPGYKYNPKEKISNFLDPGYFRESMGIGYQPTEILKTRIGAALKQTVTRNYPKPYADDPDTEDKVEKTKNEVGAESVTDVNWKITENTLLTSKLELFSNLKAFDEIDVNWDTILMIKISQYFNVNFNVKLFYDKDISKKRQLKQALALGLTYNFL